MKQKINFVRFIRLWGIVSLAAFAGIILIIDIVNTYRDFSNRADKMRSVYVDQQKQRIKQEVLRVVDMIRCQRSSGKQRAREIIRERVYEACAIAQNIYRKNRNIRSSAEIQQMILDTLRPVRFEHGHDYYFVVRLDGVGMFFAGKPEMEGQNLLNVQGANGQYVVKDMIEIAKRDGEGFYEYYRTEPDAGGSRKKISFIKFFEPYNVFIGTGLYVDDIEDRIKKEVLNYVAKIRFGPDRDGYIFVVTYDGTTLMNDTQRHLIGKNIWNMTDPDGIKVIQEERRAVENPEGDFIYYSWNNPSRNEISPKVSFMKGINDWEWMVGAGVYLDDVEKDIALMKTELNRSIGTDLFYFILIVAGIAVLFLFLFNRLILGLKSDFNLFILFFKRAVFFNEPIDIDKVRFVEFGQMAENANKMLQDKINTQQELLDEREQLFVTIRSIGDGVITTDKSGNIELMNKVAEKLTGWTLEEAEGRPLTEVFCIVNDNTGEPAGNPVNKVLEKGHMVGLANHTVLISRDGTEYNIADSAAPIRDITKSIRGVVLVFRDVTEKMKTERELLKAKKLESIGILAGGIAHDFNNILTGLFGNIELAKLEIPQGYPARRFLETADHAMEKATHLAKQLLTFAKGGDPVLEAVNLALIVQSTVKFNLSGSSVKAVFNLPDDLWQIKADKGQISQVIANLTINAKEAMPDGGSLYIGAENVKNPVPAFTGDFVKLTVRDEGIGMPKEHFEKIFDPYFTTKQAGSGLGLATAHSIIIRHNGYISVDSAAGTGITFTIHLPAERSSRVHKAAAGEDPAEKAESVSGRVLVMDDEKMVRDVSAAMLEACGYTVDLAADGKEAIEKYTAAEKKGKPFDAVIMDLTIPGGMGGKEAVRKLLAIDPGARVIVSSGYSTDPIMANYSDYGFKGRIVKPFQLKNLKKELFRVVYGKGKIN